MSFIKTLLIGTLAVLGGCTVMVGGCSVGVAKAGIGVLDAAGAVSINNSFNELYAKNPARAEAKYVEVTTDCYEKTMTQILGNVPEHVVTERVNFDIYEIRIKQSGDQNNIQHLPAWRQQAEAKIVASVADKSQRRQVKKYLKKIKKTALLETMCIANGLAPKEDSRSTSRQASLRR